MSEVSSFLECRAQIAKLGSYHLINLYAPSGSNHKTDRRNFFGQDVFRLIRGLNSTSSPILGGDFNCVLSPLDTEKNFCDKTCPALKDLVTGFNYSDAFRLLKPGVSEFTFHRKNSALLLLDWIGSTFLQIWFPT